MRKKSEVVNVLLTDIDLIKEYTTRKSFFKILEKLKPENWEKILDMKNHNASEIKKIMDSMKSTGQVECIGLHKIEVSEELLKEDGREGVYFLVFGLRRFVAAYLLGWERIKAVILNRKS